MQRMHYTRSLLAMAVAGFCGTAHAQQSCEAQIDRLQTQLQQEQQISSEVRNAIQQILAEAEGSSQNCDQLVSEAEQVLAEARQQAGEQPQRQQQAQQRQQPGQQQSAQRQQSAQQRQSAQSDDTTEIDVQSPAPEVAVQQQSPQVSVEQRAPDVQVTQPEPQVTVRQPEPQVTVNQAEPQVEVNQAEPQVRVQQSEPQVRVQQGGEPDVRVVRPESESQAQSSRQASREQQQASSEQQQASRQQQASSRTQPTRSATLTPSEALELTGQRIETRQGERLGEVSEVVRSQSGEDFFAVAEIDGERKAIPFGELEFDPQRNLVSLMSRQELQQLPRYDEQQYRPAQAAGDGGRLPSFEEVDRNDDAMLSRAEVASVEGIDFATADTNQDGSVSRDEYQQAQSQ